ncbi:MAG: L-serine ammonia-lyase, iron-sulfur-dependent, subunit alpha [Pseudomonadota bacterium]
MSYSVKDILRMEVAPALGCTEPVAIALGAAAAASLLKGKEIESIELWVDPNIYKNGMAVSIPGTKGLSGLDTAAALGGLVGDPFLKMEVLAHVDDIVTQQASAFLTAGKVTVNLLSDHKGLYIKTIVKSGRETAESIIQDLHDNIVELSKNGKKIKKNPLLTVQEKEGEGTLASLESWLTKLSLEQLFDLMDELDGEDLAFLEEGLRINLRLSDYGLKHGPGMGIGMALERLAIQKVLRRDMVLMAKILTSAAADARMGGVKLPAMTSAGSGNYGLTATLPIHAVSEFIETSSLNVMKAIGFSHIITAYIKAHTGRLSALCGCSIAAGASAAAAVTFLLGGTVHHIAGAIKNITEDLAGVICDGAKAGCALKLSTAAGSAVQAALFSLQGVTVMPTDGIIGFSPEQTMKNIGLISTDGMIEMDRTILKIMIEKKFSGF